MRFKRLYYNPAIHGGSVGVHDLMQGRALADMVVNQSGQVRVIATLAGVAPGDSFDLGTIDQPAVVHHDWAPEWDSINDCPDLGNGSRLVTVGSNWAIRVNIGTFTAGLYEFLVPLWVS